MSGSPRPGWTWPAAIAALVFALHLSALTRYGWFRDELYYVVCSERLAWGYVDHPPFSVALLALVRAVFGDSLAAMRVVTALAHVALVLLGGVIAGRMGGGSFARAVTALMLALAPVYLAVAHFWSMNVLELLLWAAVFAIAAGILARDDGSRRAWVALGIVAGIGLLNKISMGWLVAGLGVGLVLAERRRLARPGPWIAVALALALFAPHLAWQVANGFPTLEFMRNAAREKMVATPPLEYLQGQLLTMNPGAAPLWIAGLVALLLAPWARRWRALGLAFLAVAAIVVVNPTSRASYLAPAYPPLFAAGAIALERLRRFGPALRVVAVALVVAGALVALPTALPVLPVGDYVRFARATGTLPRAEERGAIGELPQHFADMHGWDELVTRVARAWNGLAPEERARAAIFAQNYGEAGALTVLGRRHGLPPAISGHNEFWRWGTRGAGGEVVIVLGGDPADNVVFFERFTVVDTVRCEWCMPYERDLPIGIGRGLRHPLSEVWGDLRHYE